MDQKLLLVISAIIFSCSLQSQINSEGRFEEMQEDVVQDLGWQLIYADSLVLFDVDSAVSILWSVIERSEAIDYQRGIALAYSQLGFAMDRRADYAQGIHYYRKGLQIKKAVSDSSFIWNLGEIGYCKDQLGERDSALFYFGEVMSTADRWGDDFNSSLARIRIGRQHYLNQDLGLAMNYFSKALDLARKLQDPFLGGQALDWISSIYLLIGDLDKAVESAEEFVAVAESHYDMRLLRSAYSLRAAIRKELGRPDEAIEDYRLGYKLSRQIEDFPGICHSLESIGWMYWEMGLLDSAQAVFQTAIRAADSAGLEFYRSGTLRGLAELALIADDPELALDYASSAYEMSKALMIELPLAHSSDLMYRVNEQLGDFETALYFHREAVRWKDSTRNERFIDELLKKDLQSQFRVQQLSDSLDFSIALGLEQARSQRQRYGLILAVLVSLSLIAIGIVIYRGKKQSDRLLLNILPRKTADELKASGAVRARSIENVSILFTDFKDFTSISSAMPVKDLVEELHQCFQHFDKLVSEAGVEKIKTIGDAYMAAAGLEGNAKSQAAALASVALQMQEFMEHRAAKFASLGKPAFRMRAGIHSGPVAAGVVGTHKFQYDLWGETVNLASRLESAAGIGRVNISEQTRQMLGNAFYLEERGQFEVKGGGPMVMYHIAQGSTESAEP